MKVGVFVVWCFGNIENIHHIVVKGKEGSRWQGGGRVRGIGRRRNKIKVATKERRNIALQLTEISYS
jgi:hypothetical protein